MKYLKSFMDEIPIEYKSRIIDKVKIFEQQLLSNIDIHSMPKGFWIRKIKNTDVFKFRVSSGDRILFIIKNNEVIFLHYCNHDEQIYKGKNMNTSAIDNNVYNFDFSIDASEYYEDEWDEKINEYITQEVYSILQKVEYEDVTDDEYIRLSIEMDDLNEIHYLSYDQYECIKETKKNVFVHGCAGSGKTNIAISKLKLNNKLSISTCYITDSNLLSNKVKELYNYNEEAEDCINICTYKDICFNLIEAKSDTVMIGYEEFADWIKYSEVLDEYNIDLSAREIWIEINSKIKGIDINRKIIDLKMYEVDKSSCYDSKIKKQIYSLANKYELWLSQNRYYDKNDLAQEAYYNIKKENKYDYIIYDEAQELTEKQIQFLKSLCNNDQGFLMLGDINQTINVSNTNYNILKNTLIKNSEMLSYNVLLKDYRNVSGIVEFINQLLKLKKKLFKNYGSEFTKEICSIQDGAKPNIIYVLSKKQEFFKKSSKMLDGAVIVAEKEDREGLIKQGIESSRIFTIEEIRGLEYENIYCYNIISKFKTILNSLLLEESKKSDLIYSIYFNILYIAATRATKNLYFIEDEKTKLYEYLKQYFNRIYDEELLLESINISLSKEEWEKEAEKLEKGGRYYPAYEAYKKAGNISMANICYNAYNKEISYKDFNENSSIIEIRGKHINRRIIENVLYEIFEQYGVYMDGFIYIVRYDDIVKRVTTATRYVETQDDIFKLSQIISNEFKSKDFNKSWICICGSYYRDGKLVDLDDIFRNNMDLEVNVLHDIVIKENTYHDRDYYMSDFKKNINNDWIQIEKNADRFDEKTADEILNDIFS